MKACWPPIISGNTCSNTFHANGMTIHLLLPSFICTSIVVYIYVCSNNVRLTIVKKKVFTQLFLIRSYTPRINHPKLLYFYHADCTMVFFKMCVEVGSITYHLRWGQNSRPSMLQGVTYLSRTLRKFSVSSSDSYSSCPVDSCIRVCHEPHMLYMYPYFRNYIQQMGPAIP